MILRAFGRVRRPFAWACFAGGTTAFVLIVARVIARDEPWTAAFAALLLLLDGYDKVADVEQAIDSDAAVDADDA